MDGAHGGSHDDVAGGFLDDGQGLENGHAATDQSAQGAGKSRNGDLADHRAQHRHVQFELVEHTPPKTGADKRDEGSDGHDDANRRHNKVAGDGVADAQHEPGEGREILARKHVLEDLLELGHHKNHQHGQDDNRHRNDGAGIEHGGDDLAFDLLGFFHELGQTREHDFQHATQFAGFHHVDKKAVKNLGMLSEGFGKGAAAFDRDTEFADDLFEGGLSFLFFQHAQAAEQGKAG